MSEPSLYRCYSLTIVMHNKVSYIITCISTSVRILVCDLKETAFIFIDVCGLSLITSKVPGHASVVFRLGKHICLTNEFENKVRLVKYGRALPTISLDTVWATIATVSNNYIVNRSFLHKETNSKTELGCQP